MKNIREVKGQPLLIVIPEEKIQQVRGNTLRHDG